MMLTFVFIGIECFSMMTQRTDAPLRDLHRDDRAILLSLVRPQDVRPDVLNLLATEIKQFRSSLIGTDKGTASRVVGQLTRKACAVSVQVEREQDRGWTTEEIEERLRGEFGTVLSRFSQTPN